MNLEEFLKPDTPEACELPAEEPKADEQQPEELDVQKAVVESLAADKAEQAEELRAARQQLAIKDGQIKAQEAMMASYRNEIAALKSKVAEVESRLAAEQSKEFDQQERNPNALALLDRDIEVPDRFPGESRDHVIEALAEARKQAEADGRIRHAQVLESVLVANEPNGTLAKRRAELEKLFNDNANVINGTVIAELERRGIPHKNGEEYLLASEIVKRTY